MKPIQSILAAAAFASGLGAVSTPNSTACPRADVNRDGQVNARDVYCMEQAVLATLGVPGAAVKLCHVVPWRWLDLNCDRRIDISDLHIVIFAATSGWLPVAIDQDQNGCVDTCE